MIPKFFGQYLLERQIIDGKQLVEAIEFQEKAKQKLGEIAITNGFISEKQAKEVNLLQQSTDKMFGELALENNYITQKQLDKIIIIQKNSHVYLGEALIALKILTKKQVNEELKKFHKEYGDKDIDLKIPFDIEEKEIIPYFADLTIKYLRRIADVISKPGEVIYKEGKTNINYLSIMIEFSKGLNIKYMLSLSEGVMRKIALGYLGETITDEEMLIENAKEFVNMVCGNVVSVLEAEGKRVEISVPKVYSTQYMDFIEFEENEKAIVIPLATTEGYCEAQIIILNVGVADMAGVNKTKVLIVDDSKSVAYKLTKIIEVMPGFEVVGHAISGEKAIEMYKDLQPNLVTMDLVLPEMSGIEAIQKIKKMDRDAIIVVISSVGGGQERLFEAIQAGAKNVITKPFNEETVKKVFTQCVL